jgi:hypothetical protein
MALAVSYPIQTRNSRSELIYDIPGLEPMPTTTVEGLPLVRPGQSIPLTNEEWFDWEPLVHAHRMRVFAETSGTGKATQRAREREIDRIVADERYWFNTFSAIYEARASEPEESIVLEDEEIVQASYARFGAIAYILYPFQDYYIVWQRDKFRIFGAKGDTVVLKSRDMGMSNTVVGMCTIRWVTRKVFQGRFYSRNEALVDSGDDPDAMMWKMDLMIKATPRFVLDHFHPGFTWQDNRRRLNLNSPSSFNTLIGESTNEFAGTAKRAGVAVLDEFTKMRNLRTIWQGTGPVTPSRIAVGSASTKVGMDGKFLAESGVPSLIVLDSRLGMHPRQSSEWHQAQRAREVFQGEYQQEYGMDWFADATDFVYPEALKKTFGDFDYVPFAGPAFCCIDDGNYWAMWFAQYIESEGRVRLVDSYRNSGKRVDFYGALFRGQMLSGFDYGSDERRVLALMHRMPISMYFGDTHGAHVEQIAGMSVIEHMATHWGIHINIDYHRRTYLDRQKALADAMPILDINDTPGNRAGWANVQMYKYKETPPGKETQREVRTPLHNDSSHDPTALEFGFTQFDDLKHQFAGSRIQWIGEPAL